MCMNVLCERRELFLMYEKVSLTNRHRLSNVIPVTSQVFYHVIWKLSRIIIYIHPRQVELGQQLSYVTVFAHHRNDCVWVDKLYPAIRAKSISETILILSC
jgi:hypothetical protein